MKNKSKNKSVSSGLSGFPKKAVLLIGGEGTRLRPITYEIPKPLVPLQGKVITEHVVELFKKYGINDMILATGYMKEKIRAYFGDGSKLGVRITYSEEDKFLGTAGALGLAREHLKNSSNSAFNTFVCCNGDELKDIDLNEMYALHKKENALVTIALTAVDDPSAYGVVKMRGSKIIEFIEKPKKEDAPSNLISAGLYMIEPEVLELIPKNKFCSIEREIFPMIAAQSRLHGYVFKGQWFDAGTFERYERALREWKGIK